MSARLCLCFNSFLLTYPTEDLLNLFERPKVAGFSFLLLSSSFCLHLCKVLVDISNFLDTICFDLPSESNFKALYFKSAEYFGMATVCLI